jgi:hypothetical protein
VSAVPEVFRRELPKPRAPHRAAQSRDDERAMQTFWPWLAVGVLVFCWVAEATLCAQRGF